MYYEKKFQHSQVTNIHGINRDGSSRIAILFGDDDRSAIAYGVSQHIADKPRHGACTARTWHTNCPSENLAATEASLGKVNWRIEKEPSPE